MAVTKNAEPLLCLMPPSEDTPAEPKCYGSPAKCMVKKECLRVERVPSIDRLLQQAAIELEAVASKKEAKKASDDEEGEEDDDVVGANVYTYKKSQYWSKEVEEKLGLSGADPYGLLELEEKRWRATADEIRKAYRKLVLTHHPDKKQGEEASKKAKEVKEVTDEAKENNGDEEETVEEEDTEFKLLSAAWDLLGNTEARRQYDSIDNFNDFLPTAFNAKKSGRSFYSVFSAPFARQSKFSNKMPVPQLGDESTPYETLTKFYKFWFDFSSWRDFALLAEHDYKEAEDREERRWMQRQNKNFTDRIKKDERQRVGAFVQLAYDNDPRIIAFKEKAAAEKAAVKAEKEAAIVAKKEAEEAAVREKEKALREANAAAEAKGAEAKAASADAKREKERLRSALKKARKEFKTLGESGVWSARASDIDVVAAVLELAALTELTTTLAAGVSDEATAALDAAVELAMKQ